MEEGLKARLSDDLEKKAKFQSGWKQSGEMWIGVHLGKQYQSPPQSMGAISSTTPWKRITLMKSGRQWHLMEMCEDLLSMRNQEEPLEGVEENILVMTILTKEGMTTEQMGFEVGAEIMQPVEAQEGRENEIPMDEPNQPEVPDEGVRERLEDGAEQEARKRHCQ